MEGISHDSFLELKEMVESLLSKVDTKKHSSESVSSVVIDNVTNTLLTLHSDLFDIRVDLKHIKCKLERYGSQNKEDIEANAREIVRLEKHIDRLRRAQQKMHEKQKTKT